MVESTNKEEKKELSETNEGKIEYYEKIKKYLREPVIIGAIVVALAVIFGSYMISESIAKLQLTSGGSSGSPKSLLESYLQTLPVVPLPNITEINPTYGDPNNANVIVYEYTDYQCPYCDRFHITTFDQIKENYINTGKIAWVHKDFPLSFHQYTYLVTQYLTCVYKLYGFKTWDVFQNWSWYNYGLSGGVSWATLPNESAVYEAFNKEAENLGLDVNKIKECVDSKTYYNQIVQGVEEATNVYGVSGTPTFIVAAKTSSIDYGAIQQVQNVLNQLRQYGLSYTIYRTPDSKYILIEFAGALPYYYFDQIFRALTTKS
ncbi:MAG: DsbA family protein [Nanopusillaceae archaeon]